MGTEILRPQDCLVERFHVAPAGFHGRRHYIPHGYPKSGHRKPAPPAAPRTEPRRKPNQHHHHHLHHKQQQQPPARSVNHTDEFNGSRPVMGRVTLMRRGQSLDSLNSQIKSNTGAGGGGLAGPRRFLGPEQHGGGCCPADVYAGSAFSMSPSPSSLPLPSFFKKQEMKPFDDDSATRDLRRLLRLE